MEVIIVDSSIWIDHLRSPEPGLAMALSEGMVLQHPFVTSELALGSLANRVGIVAMLGDLPQAQILPHVTFLNFIEEARLPETGLGMVDAHLLASAAAFDTVRLWTRDKRLAREAERLDLAHALQ
jgi:predicted nucleic acid-binding protein